MGEGCGADEAVRWWRARDGGAKPAIPKLLPGRDTDPSHTAGAACAARVNPRAFTVDQGILSHSSHTHRDYSDGDDDAYRDVLFVRITDPHCSQNRLNDTHEIFLHGGRRHGLVVLRSVQSGGNCSKSPNRLSIYYLIGLNHLRNDTTYFAFSRALL